MTAIQAIAAGITGGAQTGGQADHLSALLEMVHDAALVLGPQLTIDYWNAGAQRLYGLAADARERPLEQVLGVGAAPSSSCLAHLADTGRWEGEAQWTMPGGRVVCVERRCATSAGPDGRQAILIVDSDVGERRRADKEIVLLNNVLEQRIRHRTAELEETNGDLRGFAQSLAHDLRGPLSSIDGFSAQLQRRLGGHLDEQCSHYLDRLRAGVQHMAGLTDAMLALAELSGAPLQHEPVDLSDLARDSLDRLRKQRPDHRPTVMVDPTPPVRGDARLLSMALDELLGNAWKFTSTHGAARIRFTGSGQPDGRYVFEVHDNGVGFDPHYARQLFEPFQRLHASTQFDGYGIGLAMVRKIVARHGGRVWADSMPGRGASFRFTLGAAGAQLAGAWGS